jgi:starch phosphorylase
VKVDSDREHHRFEAHVFTGKLDPNYLRVELYADGVHGGPPEVQEMERKSQDAGGYVYMTEVSTKRASVDYTVRIIPRSQGAAVPLEASCILWQR